MSLAVQWKISDGLSDYHQTVAAMETHVERISEGKAPEMIWLLQHPPLYTAGRSANPKDLIDSSRFPVFKSGRGGQYTYHGPGQRVVYVMLDLKKQNYDIRGLVTKMEQWIIATLADFHINGQTARERVGVWVKRPEKPSISSIPVTEDKIAAIGIRLRRWISFHGLSININPDLNHFSGIIPCGLSDYGVTSFEDLDILAPMSEVDLALRRNFEAVFQRKTHFC